MREEITTQLWLKRVHKDHMTWKKAQSDTAGHQKDSVYIA